MIYVLPSRVRVYYMWLMYICVCVCRGEVNRKSGCYINAEAASDDLIMYMCTHTHSYSRKCNQVS